MKDAKGAGFNTIVIGFRAGINLNSLKVPTPTSIGLSREYLKTIKRYAVDLDLELVPEFKLLTHQEQFFKISIPNVPNEMFNLTTYNPSSPLVREKVEGVLSELIELWDPKQSILAMMKWQE